jgi:hypothetical protein
MRGEKRKTPSFAPRRPALKTEGKGEGASEGRRASGEKRDSSPKKSFSFSFLFLFLFPLSRSLSSFLVLVLFLFPLAPPHGAAGGEK